MSFAAPCGAAPGEDADAGGEGLRRIIFDLENISQHEKAVAAKSEGLTFGPCCDYDLHVIRYFTIQYYMRVPPNVSVVLFRSHRARPAVIYKDPVQCSHFGAEPLTTIRSHRERQSEVNEQIMNVKCSGRSQRLTQSGDDYDEGLMERQFEVNEKIINLKVSSRKTPSCASPTCRR